MGNNYTAGERKIRKQEETQVLSVFKKTDILTSKLYKIKKEGIVFIIWFLFYYIELILKNLS